MKEIGGSLLLIDEAILTKKRLINYLFKWRLAAYDAFEDDFIPTYDSTRAWVKSTLLSDDNNRLYFVIYKGRYMGHVGLKSGNEINNVIRGRKGGKGLMTKAIETLITIAQEEFNVATFSVRTRRRNLHAQDFYYRLGFRPIMLTDRDMIMER